jgi:hypothetical protein
MYDQRTRLNAGALDRKLLATLRRQVPLTPTQAEQAIAAGFKVGRLTHAPIGTKRKKPYIYFYMRRAAYLKFRS